MRGTVAKRLRREVAPGRKMRPIEKRKYVVVTREGKAAFHALDPREARARYQRLKAAHKGSR